MAAEETIDDVDRTILDLLREDARRSVTDIARRVNLTTAPVARRIERLERLGVITGYTVLVDDRHIDPPLEAFIELRIAGAGDLDDAIATVVSLEAVRDAYTTAGDPDILLHVLVDDVTHLQRVVNDLRRTGKFAGTKTLMTLGRFGGARRL